jgi:transmembrane sensor
VHRLCGPLLRDGQVMSLEEEKSGGMKETRIKQVASDWVAKQDRGFTAEEQDAFFEWLAMNSLHSELYNRRQIVWKEMNVLADWKPEHSIEPNPDLLAVSNRRSKLVWFSAISGVAALLAIGLFIGGQWTQSNSGESMMLAAGEGAQFYEYHVLEDGSAVELNRGAQVSVRFTDEKRLVDLLAGEAHFTVSKDASRPFIVRARGTVVQAVGTAFSVLLNSDRVEVLVTEGRVLVNPSIATTRESVIDESEPLVRSLTAGQRSVVDFQSVMAPPVIEEISLDSIDLRLAWKNERLDFTDTPLSEVILEFNRRNHTQFVIGDEPTKAIPISGTLKPQNIDDFIEMLEVTAGVRAKREDVSKIVLSGSTE